MEIITQILCALAGLAVGAVIPVLLLHGRSVRDKAMLENEQKARAEEKQAHANQLDELNARHSDAMADLKAIADQRIENVLSESKARIEEVKSEATERRDKELSALRQQFDEQLKLFHEQVITTTEKLLKERSGELQSTNSKVMDEIVKPLKETITNMERTMTATREAGVHNATKMEEQIKNLLNANIRLGDETSRLSNALLRKNKVAGNWGELILSELLEEQGLKPGVNFDVQKSLRDASGKSTESEEKGKRLIPDVVLHLEDKRDVVIDSKMSLTAFVDYQNAETEEERQDAIKRHLDSVRAHVKELSAKDYSKYLNKGQTQIDFVIMFVPIDNALQLAVNSCPSLLNEAFEQKVLIANGPLLLAGLRIIKLAWVNVQQQRNTEKVMDEARKLIDRVNDFYTAFKTFGDAIENMSDAYEGVIDSVDGRTSILKTARRLEKLGARGKKSLPRINADNVEDVDCEEEVENGEIDA